MEHKSIEEPIGAPGGWALPEHIETVRAALRRERSYLRSIRRAAEQRAGIIAATPGHSVEHLANTRALVVRWGEKLAVCEATIKLFDGIAHGAQIVALASPEEEAAHHLHVTARGRAALESLAAPVFDAGVPDERVSILARVIADGSPHQRVSIFAGPDEQHRANCGFLTMREGEATEIVRMLASGGASIDVWDRTANA